MNCQFILLLTNRASDLLWIIEQPLNFRWLLNEVWGWYNLSNFEIGKEKRRAGWRFAGLLQAPWVRSWPTCRLLKEFIEAFFPRKQKRSYASSGTLPRRGGPFGQLFPGSRNLQVAFQSRYYIGGRYAGSCGRAFGYHLVLQNYQQSFVDIDSLRF